MWVYKGDTVHADYGPLGSDHMPLRIEPDTFRDALGRRRPAAGRDVGVLRQPARRRICAGSGLDWLLIDAEHCPNGLESILAQLQAVARLPGPRRWSGRRSTTPW